jgi:ABC-type transport system involved in cytochrome c biogenesis permease component
MRHFYDVNDLLISFAVFAVIPLLLAAVFRSYLAAARFKRAGLLRPSEVLPLYFPGIISGISEREARPRRTHDILPASVLFLPSLCAHSTRVSAVCDGNHWSRRCPVS